MNILSNLFNAFVGAVIGLIVTTIFQERINRWRRKTTYQMRMLISRFRKSSSIPRSNKEFHLGKWQVGWEVVEGSSAEPYIPENIICRFNPTLIRLPLDRSQRKEQIEKEQAKREKTHGKRQFHNGQTVALAGIGHGQLGEMEAPMLVLQFQQSDYYSYLATAVSLDETLQAEDGETITVRDKYLHGLHFETPIPEFASAFPINLTVITNDGYILMSKRAIEGISGYAGYIFPAVNECVNPLADRSATGELSLFKTAQRAASYELNIKIEEDELLFFTLGVDIRWYYYGLTGTIRSKTFSRDDIYARRSIGSKERWESNELYFLPHNPDEIAKKMSELSRTEKWGPVGVVCLVQTMVAEFGVKETERALRKYPPRNI